MKSFKDLAKNVTTLSPLMEGKDKISTEAIINDYSDGISITAFDFVTNTDGETYCVFNFAENDKVFANGGSLLNKIFSAGVDEFGTLENANAELKKNPLKVKLEQSRTKNGNNFTNVIII